MPVQDAEKRLISVFDSVIRRSIDDCQRDRLLLNFGGNLPTTPYSQDSDGRGPAWANSLFEDNAEFGLGMNMALEALQSRAQRLLGGHTPQSPLPDLRSQIGELKQRLPAHSEEQLLADYLSEKWCG